MSKESRQARRKHLFAIGALPKKPVEKPLPVVTLVWKDGVETAAKVERLAPEIVCGKSRFRRQDEKGTIYTEV